MKITQSSASNLLLRNMLPDDYALIENDIVRIPLPVGLRLHEAHRAITRVYFPEDGLVSIVAVTPAGKQCEVGVFGREGMSETATVLGTDNAPYEAYVQVGGVSALSLPVESLTEAFDASPTLRRHLLRYCQAMMIQLSSSIAAAGLTIPQRLARWLLMAHDRAPADNIGLTHEFLSMMLGVRRGGVTIALQTLTAAGMIATSRSVIAIRDRAGLKLLAGDGYGLAESEYERLIGEPLERTGHFDARTVVSITGD
ncbi:Crp/Fnr family transcriptional regulator [Glacieibacterium megasporae]|uniref:Crp/Fnr family transcriptional regulator n=1 Tax=Glacieibacterium megasporae TaxID=2835787 RepID=UPI001C1DF08A|nr:Crp/Fnr family transcriptional regulator [Polymorphobacter megasporae]UAJ11176.1 Crp/Fnr family transcriptional regulator [Polymorphobacter megasporae]